MSQSNSRFNDLDALAFEIHTVKMPVVYGGHREIKNKGRPLSVMTHLKSSITEVKAETVWQRSNYSHINDYKRSKLSSVSKRVEDTPSGKTVTGDVGYLNWWWCGVTRSQQIP